MNTVIYSRENSALVAELICSIKRENSVIDIITGKSILELLEIIKIKGTVNTLCVLILKDMRDSMALMSRKELFWKMNLIILINIGSEKKISFAHELHPRYIGLISDNKIHVVNVMNKILKENSCKKDG